MLAFFLITIRAAFFIVMPLPRPRGLFLRLPALGVLPRLRGESADPPGDREVRTDPSDFSPPRRCAAEGDHPPLLGLWLEPRFIFAGASRERPASFTLTTSAIIDPRLPSSDFGAARRGFPAEMCSDFTELRRRDASVGAPFGDTADGPTRRFFTTGDGPTSLAVRGDSRRGDSSPPWDSGSDEPRMLYERNDASAFATGPEFSGASDGL